MSRARSVAHLSVTYLDANATQPLRPEARQAMLDALNAGNPSSVHASGRHARRILEDARDILARRLGGIVVFTSGGTEANAAAIHALRHGRRVLVGATEHDAVRGCGADGTLAVTQDGTLRLDDLEAALLRATVGRPALVCLMLANNETGVIHPIAEAATLCRRHGALLHVDAVQATGRIAFDLASLGADSLAVSSHKLGGPAGAGAWVMAQAHTPRPLVAGGGQEGGWRGGTPALACIAGFAAALDASTAPSAALRDAVEAAATAQGALVVGAAAPRLPNTACLALPGVPAQTQVMALDLAGIAVSAGAACSSGRVGRSHVLDAMGLGPLAAQAIRVSLPWSADAADVARFVAAYAAMVTRLQAVRISAA